MLDLSQKEIIISWSGGKDSTASILLALENDIKISRICHVDMRYDDETPAILPEHYEFVMSAAERFRSMGLRVDIERSRKTAHELASYISTKGNCIGRRVGMLDFIGPACGFKRVKINTADGHWKRFLQSSNPARAGAVCDLLECVGIAADEPRRLVRLGKGKFSLLAEKGITEKQAAEICKKHNLLSPIYSIEGIKRDGCFFCPHTPALRRAFVKQKHPELLPKIWEMFRLCNYPPQRWRYMRTNKWFSDWLEAEAWEG